MLVSTKMCLATTANYQKLFHLQFTIKSIKLRLPSGEYWIVAKTQTKQLKTLHEKHIKKMKYTNLELQQAYDELVKIQSFTKTVIGALIGTVFACGVFFFFAQMQGLLVIFLAIPPVLIGFFAKLFGQPYEVKPRIVVAVLAFILHIFGCYYLQLFPLFYLFAPIAAGIAFIVSKIKLTRIENVALDMAELGRIKHNSQTN